jgi:hypothetical protein
MDISNPHLFKKLDSSYCGFRLSSLFLKYDFFFQPFVDQTSPGNKAHYIEGIWLILIEVAVVKLDWEVTLFILNYVMIINITNSKSEL